MRTVSLAEAKAHLSESLNKVEAGEEVVITLHGRAVVRVSPLDKAKRPLPIKQLAALRKTEPAWTDPSAGIVRQLRDAE